MVVVREKFASSFRRSFGQSDSPCPVAMADEDDRLLLKGAITEMRKDPENHGVITTPPPPPTTTTHILMRDTTDPNTFGEAVWGRVFNRHRDESRVPRAVVEASCVAHVREAVGLAARLRCRASVRSGGHSWAAWSVRQDAVLVDLGGLRRMAYDERTKVVSCSPSTTGEQLNRFLGAYGRMFAGGHCPDVGLGGFLLQGGSRYSLIPFFKFAFDAREVPTEILPRLKEASYLNYR